MSYEELKCLEEMLRKAAEEAYAKCSEAMKAWHKRERELTPYECALDEPLRFEFIEASKDSEIKNKIYQKFLTHEFTF